MIIKRQFECHTSITPEMVYNEIKDLKVKQKVLDKKYKEKLKELEIESIDSYIDKKDNLHQELDTIIDNKIVSDIEASNAAKTYKFYLTEDGLNQLRRNKVKEDVVFANNLKNEEIAKTFIDGTIIKDKDGNEFQIKELSNGEKVIKAKDEDGKFTKDTNLQINKDLLDNYEVVTKPQQTKQTEQTEQTNQSNQTNQEEFLTNIEKLDILFNDVYEYSNDIIINKDMKNTIIT